MLSGLRRYMALLLAIVLAGTAGFAQSGKYQKKMMLWKATSPTATVYMVGSIHVARSDIYPLPSAVEKAFQDAQVLAVEVNTKKIDQQQMLATMQQAGMYPAGESLSKHIPKETRAMLDTFCEKQQVPCAVFETMRPWMAAMVVGVLPFLKAGANAEQGIDVHFLNEAGKQRIDELESMQSQLDLFTTMSDKEQAQFLRSTLESSSRDSIEAIERAFLTADSETLLKRLDNNSDMPELSKKMIDDRNISMAEHVERYLKGSGTVFLVVGEAHLIGDKGVVRLLKKKQIPVQEQLLTWN